MRTRPAPIPKAMAVLSSVSLSPGSSRAGAKKSANIEEASPLMNEQFRLHSVAGSSGGVNCRVPPSSPTSRGRARPQLSLKIVFATSPGPTASTAMRNQQRA